MRFNLLAAFGPISYQCDSAVIGISELFETLKTNYSDLYGAEVKVRTLRCP